MVDAIVRQLDMGKGSEIAVLDISRTSSFTDYLIIATGTSARHVMALGYHLGEDLKKQNVCVRVEGRQGDGSWIAVDAGSIVVHLFTADTRRKYNLEELWR